MVSINRVYINQSLSRTSESSTDIYINDEESIETHSSDSGSVIIQDDDSSSPPSYTRQVIIKSPNRITKILTKSQQKHRIQKTQQIKIIYEKELIYKNHSLLYSSKIKHYYSPFKQYKHKEDKLKYLYNKYSKENIHQEWKPLTHTETRELCQYAFDKYYKKISF